MGEAGLEAGPQKKSQKNRKSQKKIGKCRAKKISFLNSQACVKRYITRSPYVSNKILYLWDIRIIKKFITMDGLRIKDGRLINDRPVGVTGIAQASMLRKQNKQRSLTQDIALGIESADDRKSAKEAIRKFLK